MKFFNDLNPSISISSSLVDSLDLTTKLFKAKIEDLKRRNAIKNSIVPQMRENLDYHKNAVQQYEDDDEDVEDEDDDDEDESDDN